MGSLARGCSPQVLGAEGLKTSDLSKVSRVLALSAAWRDFRRVPDVAVPGFIVEFGAARQRLRHGRYEQCISTSMSARAGAYAVARPRMDGCGRQIVRWPRGVTLTGLAPGACRCP